MILKGKIIKGMGIAKKFVDMMSETFYNKTGFKLYPGTLNVKLNNPYVLNADYIIKPEEYGGNYNVYVQKCRLLQEYAYIIRSEKNIGKNGNYSEDIIEIVSDVNFREKYKLNDGDILEIIIENNI